MNITIKEISIQEYQTNTSLHLEDVPIWLESKAVKFIGDTYILVAERGGKVVGIWVAPSITSGKKRMIRRSHRFFPYSSPYLLERDNIKRREIMGSLFNHAIKNCEEVSIPFDPNFKDLPILQSYGAFVEWRHTHIVRNQLEISKLTSRLRNHINSAKQKIEVVVGPDPDTFCFDMAIKGSKDEVDKRTQSAINLLHQGRGMIISGANGKSHGGIFVAFDNKHAYMMHSWQSATAPRGTISLLIYESIKWMFSNKKVETFDFEGSILRNIDYFFCGFNAEITPYGYVYWNKNINKIQKHVRSSMKIKGRLYDEALL